MKWASAIGLGRDLDSAVAEALEQLTTESGMKRPELAIAFVSAAYDSALDRLPQMLAAWLGEGLLIGCNAGGLIGGGTEVEDEPGIALLAGRLGDASLTALHLEQATLPPLTTSRETWWRLLDLGPASAASFLLLTDPATIDTEACARGIDRAFPGATVVGGLASGASEPGAVRLFANREIHRSGGLLLALTGNVVIDPVIAQGCRAIGEPLFVTACDGNLLHELDGRRPRELLAALFSSLDEADRDRFGDSLCIGLALPGPQQPVRTGEFLIRNVLGLDPDSGALWIGARLVRNAVVQFHLRDGDAASRELAMRLGDALDGRVSPVAALLFTCAARGRGMFGNTGHDSGALRRKVNIPVAGMFSAGEIGPLQGATFLHSFSSVFGLIRARFAASA
ncbi:MAG: FIST C-terminal domain-containing protein [Gammaproteobacteria bacterium]|nr:FIST C-terminal domain-containing protein [Gammaproteobacteria bacterium]